MTAETMDDSVKIITTDKPIKQSLAFVTKEAPNANVLKLIDAAKKDISGKQ